jgi:hypothetical protein
MCFEGLPARIDLVQHDGVGLLLRHEYLELQGSRLGGQTTLGVSLQVLQVFLSLVRNVLMVAIIANFSMPDISRANFKLGHREIQNRPSGVKTGQHRNPCRNRSGN